MGLCQLEQEGFPNVIFASQAKKLTKGSFSYLLFTWRNAFLSFYVLCHHGKAQSNELFFIAYVLQVILYNWD